MNQWTQRACNTSGAQTTDAPTPTAASGFDARRRLRGDYDDRYFQFRREHMAQTFSATARGIDQ